ncbi:hypothetical protein [Lactiplantibacillus songbeiensis]|uniref:Uncharacterized protein n=1 Tax=Lactiplantibacillus songbeiensis TaxID=2559920 RepID=A0ABW4C3B9_9LACO|nr:hypothetical protein [Lactiplantibacillus songbeiensis]
MDGKVIRILSDTDLIINLGSNDEVGYGNRFEIYEPGESIKDPTTHESLGVLDYIKATVEVTELHKSFSIVQHRSTKRETVSRGGLSAFSQRTESIETTKIHTLPVNKDSIEPRHIKNEQIQVGDPIRSI